MHYFHALRTAAAGFQAGRWCHLGDDSKEACRQLCVQLRFRPAGCYDETRAAAAAHTLFAAGRTVSQAPEMIFAHAKLQISDQSDRNLPVPLTQPPMSTQPPMFVLLFRFKACNCNQNTTDARLQPAVRIMPLKQDVTADQTMYPM